MRSRSKLLDELSAWVTGHYLTVYRIWWNGDGFGENTDDIHIDCVKRIKTASTLFFVWGGGAGGSYMGILPRILVCINVKRYN